jgi:predicted nuclease with TOPRIM domain
MALGKTAKRLKTLAEKVETIYERLQQMHERVAGLDDRIQRIDERMETLETRSAEQRAVLDAVAEELDIDPEAVAAGAEATADPKPTGDEEAAQEASPSAESADSA